MFRQFAVSTIHIGIRVWFMANSHCDITLKTAIGTMPISDKMKYGRIRGRSSSGCCSLSMFKYMVAITSVTAMAKAMFIRSPFRNMAPIVLFSFWLKRAPIIGVSP